MGPSGDICFVIILTLSVLEQLPQGSEIQDQSLRHMYLILYGKRNSLNSYRSRSPTSTVPKLYHVLPSILSGAKCHQVSNNLKRQLSVSSVCCPQTQFFSLVRGHCVHNLPQHIGHKNVLEAGCNKHS